MATITHVFPGGNTSEGFYSFYDYLPPPNARRIYTLKGGPGVGKSTFMRKVGEAFSCEGYDIEHHHCSSDNGSLDGVVIPDLGVALLDGTAPHVVDPKHPGAIDEILDLAAFWERDSLIANKEAILASTKEVSRLFKRAYAYLASCKSIMGDLVTLHQRCLKKDYAITKLHEMKSQLFNHPHTFSLGYERHLFGSAYTPDGHVYHTNSQLQNIQNIYGVFGSPGTGNSFILNEIGHEALHYGYSVTFYHQPLLPSELETVVIHDLNTALTTVKDLDLHYERTVDLDEGLSSTCYKRFKYEIEESRYFYHNLLEFAIRNIRMAKLEHDVLETYYVPNMNFEAQAEKRAEILTSLLKLRPINS